MAESAERRRRRVSMSDVRWSKAPSEVHGRRHPMKTAVCQTHSRNLIRSGTFQFTNVAPGAMELCIWNFGVRTATIRENQTGGRGGIQNGLQPVLQVARNTNKDWRVAIVNPADKAWHGRERRTLMSPDLTKSHDKTRSNNQGRNFGLKSGGTDSEGEPGALRSRGEWVEIF